MNRFLTLLMAAFWLTAAAQCPYDEVAIDYSIGTGSYPSEISWQLNDATGANVFTGGAGEAGTWCLAPGDYTFIGLDSFGDGWNGAVAGFSNSGVFIGSLAVEGGQGSIVLSVINDVPGCTDPDACNYDATATVDDGSCDFACYGCTIEVACNFNPAASIDDGSCEFYCPGCTDVEGAILILVPSRMTAHASTPRRFTIATASASRIPTKTVFVMNWR